MIAARSSRWSYLRHAAALGAVALFAAAGGCGSGKEIPLASCFRCGATPVTADECTALGKRNGCEVSTTNQSPCPEGMVTGCAFENCDEPPSCDE